MVWSEVELIELILFSTRDTLVIFTSDNGAALVSKQKAGSNGPLLCGKQTTFEGGMRTPTIVWWAKRKLSGVSHYPGTHMDFLPTLTELANISLPTSLSLDGQSLASIFLSLQNPTKQLPVYYYRGNLLYAVRWASYKVIAELSPNSQFCWTELAIFFIHPNKFGTLILLAVGVNKLHLF